MNFYSEWEVSIRYLTLRHLLRNWQNEATNKVILSTLEKCLGTLMKCLEQAKREMGGGAT